MPELDLIPVSYSGSRRTTRGTGTVLLLGYAAAIVLLVGVRLYLDSQIGENQSRIENLEVETQRAQQERAALARLERERSDLQQRLSVLEGLRGGIAAKDMFSVVDEAMDERVWFRHWSFRRAGEVVDRQPDAVETGYFIVLPQTAPDEPKRAWRLETHMEIAAEAEDHSSLALFVRKLAGQNEVENARILSTRQQRSEASKEQRVGFDLAVLVRSAP